MQRLRPLSEEECYLRCYGQRGAEDTVRILHDTAHRDAGSRSDRAERIRLLFDAAFDARAPEAA